MSDLTEDQKNSLRGHGLLDDGVPYAPLFDQVHPGETCDSCGRRVPFPKKATSPNTKPLAYRIPLDEADAHLEVLDAVAELLGISEEKFHRFKTISYCAAAVLLHGLRLESKDGG